jgi:DNA-binding IclR family transcriptional regulator
MEPISAAAAAVLRVLKAAHATLSREQIASETALEVGNVDELLVSLQLRGLVRCVAAPSRPRGRPRRQPTLWQAAPPDLA